MYKEPQEPEFILVRKLKKRTHFEVKKSTQFT